MKPGDPDETGGQVIESKIREEKAISYMFSDEI